MPAPHPSHLVWLALLPLVAWRVYRRFKRLVGRQRLTKYRLWIRLTVIPLLLALVVWAVADQPNALRVLGGLALGVALGAGLGVIGLKTTTFAPEPGHLYYTPNAHLGVALSLLMVARLGYRVWEVQRTGEVPSWEHFGSADMVLSPLTLVVFGLLMGYNLCYTLGLARWRARVLRAKQSRLAAALTAEDDTLA